MVNSEAGASGICAEARMGTQHALNTGERLRILPWAERTGIGVLDWGRVGLTRIGPANPQIKDE
jgi:hypothetical protein